MILTIFLNLAIPLLLTILIESFVAFTLGYRTVDDIKRILLINIFTNPAFVHLCLFYNVYFDVKPSDELIFIAEIVIIFIECKLLMISSNYSREKMLTLSFLMNMASYIATLFINFKFI